MTAGSVSAAVDAVVSRLDGELDVAVGDNRAPDGAGWQGTPGASDFYGWVVVWTPSGGGAAPMLRAAHVDVEVVFHVNSVGATPSHARSIGDDARAALTNYKLQIDGADFGFLELTAHGLERDTTVEPNVWVDSTRWLLTMTTTK